MLRSLPPFQACSDRELARVDSLVDDVDAALGETLVREGEHGMELYIIVSGRAQVASRGDVVATLGPGEFFGEMAMVDFKPRSATVVASTPMRLLVVGPKAFPTLMDTPGVARDMIHALVERLRRMDTEPR